MLVPRIVAVRIHGSDLRAHGDAAGRAWMTPSSHGGLNMFAIRLRLQITGLEVRLSKRTSPKQRFRDEGPGAPAQSLPACSSQRDRSGQSVRSTAFRKRARSAPNYYR